MAGKSATLAIRIVSDAKQAGAGFADAEAKVGGFQRGLDRASVASGALLAGLAAVATQAFDAASSLQQSSGAIESVFGAQAGAVEDYARRASQAVGLSQNSYQELASTLGSQLGNMGISTDQLVGQTDELITMGADLAATFGGTTADAVGALSSLLRGETDPIERYAVGIKQADINARLAAMGLEDLEGEQAKAAQTQAILSLLAEQTGSSMGAFARESDTAAGAQQRATAEFENASAALGEALLPLVASAMEHLAGLSGWVQENAGTVQTFALVIGGLAAAVIAVNAAFAVYTAVTRVVTAVQWLFNTALLANPIFWIVAIIAAIVAVVIILYQKFEFVRNVLAVTGDWFARAFGIAMEYIQPVVDLVQWLWDLISDAWGLISGAAEWVGDLFGGPAVVVGGGGAAGTAYGGAAGGATGGRYGATSMIGLGGGSPAAAQALGPTTLININLEGLTVDGVATGRALVRVIDEYVQSTGGAVTVQIGGTGR